MDAENVYSFLVTNKSYTFGKLWRSAREDQASDAVMLGTGFEPDDQFSDGRAALRTNARALFMIPSDNRAQRLVTSAITRVVVIKGESHLSPSR